MYIIESGFVPFKMTAAHEVGISIAKDFEAFDLTFVVEPEHVVARRRIRLPNQPASGTGWGCTKNNVKRSVEYIILLNWIDMSVETLRE